MYAIVETGGKQYKVCVGDSVKVEKLDKRNDYHKSTKKVVKKNHEEV